MGEGVSLPLPRNGFLVDNHFVVSVPFSRDLGLNGGFILEDSQAVEGDSFCENNVSGWLFCPSLNETAASGIGAVCADLRYSTYGYTDL